MLNFFMILLTNIFTGVIIYLVLTLKLEKSSTGYHIQKYKREIDEMMREFNNSAETNITLLENRIKLCKKMLKLSGSIESLDIRSIEEDAGRQKIHKQITPVKEEEYPIIHDFNIEQKNKNSGSRSFVIDEEIRIEPGRVEDEIPDIEKQLKNGGNQHETFVSLYRQGYSPLKISEASNIALPEVLLILQLNGIEPEAVGDINGF
ncbi:MAG TPA: hypothetical protein P5123_09340 [Spirochaetota bacterium]|nr:hypothetical protein [Spirochaetota bacterium]